MLFLKIKEDLDVHQVLFFIYIIFVGFFHLSSQDAFYLGSDNAMDKIKIAAQNVCSSNSERIDVALVDGLSKLNHIYLND